MECHEIDHIQFGILSSDEIPKLSVCELNSSKLVGSIPYTIHEWGHWNWKKRVNL